MGCVSLTKTARDLERGCAKAASLRYFSASAVRALWYSQIGLCLVYQSIFHPGKWDAEILGVLEPFCALRPISGLLSHVSKIDCFRAEGMRLDQDFQEELPLEDHWKHSFSDCPSCLQVRVLQVLCLLEHSSSQPGSMIWLRWSRQWGHCPVLCTPCFSLLGSRAERCIWRKPSSFTLLLLGWAQQVTATSGVGCVGIQTGFGLGVMSVAFTPSLHRWAEVAVVMEKTSAPACWRCCLLEVASPDQTAGKMCVFLSPVQVVQTPHD